MAESGIEHLTDEIRRLVREDEIELGVERLTGFLHQNVPDLYNEALLQGGRLRRLDRQERAGLITAGDAQVQRNRLSLALLGLLDEVPGRVQPSMAPLGTDIAMFAAPELPEGAFKPEKILGLNNLRQISWLEQGLEASRRVGRILTPQGVGSGFLAGGGMVMTNHHVLPSRALAEASFFELDYQQDLSGRVRATYRYRLEPKRLRTEPKLDYTLVAVLEDPDRPTVESWGALTLNPNADPVPFEHVAIIQHPNGGLKQIALTANAVAAVTPPLLHYTTDTMEGSSGSPVFNDAWQVIALHHAASKVQMEGKERYLNEGVLLSAIKKDAGEAWPGPAGGSLP